MKILVFGGAGYIGSVLVKKLLRENEVTVIDNLTFGHQSLIHLISEINFKFIYGDVRNIDVLNHYIPKFDAIIPLSAIVGAPQCDKNPIDANLINYKSIIEINNIRSKNQMLLFPNTNSGYGITDGGSFCTEESPLNPISIYGKTKCNAEKFIIDSGKPFICFRLATVFGMSPRMRTDLLLNNFVFKAVTDNCIVIFEKGFKRNFIHVQDVADCFYFAIKNYPRMKNQIYNLGLDSANVSKEELANIIKKHIPDLNIIYSEIGSDIDKRNYIVSNEKLKKVGFEGKYDLDYGIQELIKGYNLMFSKEIFRQ